MIDYQIFMKHAEKVCKSPHILTNTEKYKVLQGVKHLENGDLVVTDAHRLYLAKELHMKADGVVLTPKGMKIEGNYPDVSRIIPDSSYAKQTLEIEVEELLKPADTIYSVGTLIEEIPRLSLIENVVKYDSINVKYQWELDVRFEIPFFLNAQYVLDAMKLFKAAGCQTVTVDLHGSMRPVVFTNEDKSLLVLILPIRKY